MSRRGVLIWRKLFESGDAKRLAKQVQDLSDLSILKDIPYLADGDRGHLLDIYALKDCPEDAPVMINIHGGGLFASYKEVNVNFNYEWARLGYRVVSISYRRIPETTLWHQIEDVMTALTFIKDHSKEWKLNIDRCYLTGDSAGALLCLFALSINAAPALQEAFGIQGSGLRFRAGGLISIMLETQRKDLMRAISNVVTDPSDAGKPYEKYLLKPVLLVRETKLPPLYLITSREDLIRKDTLKLDKAFLDYGQPHILKDYPKGSDRKLIHVYSVSYPMYPESRDVFSRIDSFFRQH